MQLDYEKLLYVLKSFYTLTGVRIAVLDRHCREIAAYPREISAFCKQLRQDAAFDRMCMYSDRMAMETVKRTGKQYTYCCHAGLQESLFPIRLGKKIGGYLMIGQFIKNADKESIEDHIRRTWQDCQFSQEALYRLPTLSHDAVDSIAMIMSVCAEYLCFQNIITVKHDKRIEEVNRYIDTHLHEPISVQQLAKVFGISRTSLYMLIKNNYGKGITEHINDVKIQHAKELLQQGYSVKAILEIINISDTNYFYRMFRKCTGMTVREFKAQLKKENNEND